MSDYEMLTDLEQAVDFSIKQPVLSDSYTVFSFSDINKTMGQMIYENGGQRIAYRISGDNDDISDNYTDYSNKCTFKMEGVSIQLRSEETFHVALWRDYEFTYSVCATAGLTTEQIAQITADRIAPTHASFLSKSLSITGTRKRMGS